MGNCEDCAYSVFDRRWGEHKCKKRQHRIYIPDEMTECPSYKKDPDKLNELNDMEEEEDG